jgi:hypothetical protein
MEHEKFKSGDRVVFIPRISIRDIRDNYIYWSSELQEKILAGSEHKFSSFEIGMKGRTIACVEYTTKDGNWNSINVPIECLEHFVEEPVVQSPNRHPHADLMIAYANDCTLKFQTYDKTDGAWVDTASPIFIVGVEYRIKPDPVKKYKILYSLGGNVEISQGMYKDAEEFTKSYSGSNFDFARIIPETEKFVESHNTKV